VIVYPVLFFSLFFITKLFFSKFVFTSLLFAENVGKIQLVHEEKKNC
jgi:hypothetical protein